MFKRRVAIANIEVQGKMSDVKKLSCPPILSGPPSDGEVKELLVPPTMEKEARPIPTRTISPMPVRGSINAMHGKLVVPAPGRLTPTGQGRIKAPPSATPTLHQVASAIDVFNAEGVCFSREEAEDCARKARNQDSLGFNGDDGDEPPLNVEGCNPRSSTRTAVSSNATVVTTSSTSSCSLSSAANEAAAADMSAATASSKGPPMHVVRTDAHVNSDVEHPGSSVDGAIQPRDIFALHTDASAPEKSPALSAAFTDNLVSANSSRQGRSLQRWLVHPPTGEFVRQAAGTIPITRDGRIILVSASRKNEWILPKGGWDTDETREECAARETFEEAGLLGRLGGRLDPIDYESGKAKKRRLGGMGMGGDRPLAKRIKMETPSLSSANDPSTEVVIFEPPVHSYVRLSLFPLYVTAVKSEWPEGGRLRKLVDIDEAIRIMEDQNRPYFRRALEMAKERGLHLVKREA